MKAALKVLSQVGGANRKVAILGDILEQGDFMENPIVGLATQWWNMK